MLEIINAVVTGVGLIVLEALRQRGQKDTGNKLQSLRNELEHKLWEHEVLIRQLRVLNQMLKAELEACWADRDALQGRILEELDEPFAKEKNAPLHLDYTSQEDYN
jgi:hypothetical protein